MTQDAADRLHSGLIKSFVATVPDRAGSWIVQRAGYTAVRCPPIPLPGFNGLWIDGHLPSDELPRAIEQMEAVDVPFWLLVRAGSTGPFGETAAILGFDLEESLPGMTLQPGALVAAHDSGTAIRRITANQLDTAIDMAAEAFESPRSIAETMFSRIAAIPGFAIYEASVDGVPVSTATSWVVDGTVGIFNVATPAEHRRRGYGRAVTERAIRDALEAGADLAWLQASELGATVYRSMGFRQVEGYDVYGRPDASGH